MRNYRAVLTCSFCYTHNISCVTIVKQLYVKCIISIFNSIQLYLYMLS